MLTQTGIRAAVPALVLLFVGAALVRAQPSDVVASAQVNQTQVKLSQSVRVTLAIEGPAPLRGAMELPKSLLTADADASWRIRPDGEAEIKPLSNGRERWQQVYRLDPYVPGKPLRATFNPVTVNRQSVTWPAVEVTVERTSSESAPLPEPHSVTAVEDIPAVERPTSSDRALVPWIAGAGVLVCAVVGLAILMRRRGRRPIPPTEWARAALARLEAGDMYGDVVAERVAAILREFVERRFAVPATKLTTTELSAATAQQGWPVEQSEALRAVLDECDLAKFAGNTPDDDGCRRLIRTATDWVDHVSLPAGPG
ncbi:hypothetical protein VT84_02555 [Gemmata sp. SH-PL17]|nr:hypothetical protein VT84_02555 [Gemmata sp. SH-PL17]